MFSISGGGNVSSAPVRVGIDLCSVQEVAESIERFGDRYLRRVYTEHEVEYCAQDPALAAEPRWTMIQGATMTVVGDVPADKLRDVATQIEQFRAARDERVGGR